jgi:hypothetical protein
VRPAACRSWFARRGTATPLHALILLSLAIVAANAGPAAAQAPPAPHPLRAKPRQRCVWAHAAPPCARYRANWHTTRYGLGERGSDRRLDLDINIGRKVAISLGDQPADMRAAPTQDPSADLNGALSRKEKTAVI